MNRVRLILLVAASILGAVVPVSAIELGDPAPPLSIGKWLKGDAVDLAKGKGKHVYVIEFWATWCPPCVQSIPHLTRLQNKYKNDGAVIIGVSQEPAAVIKTFMKNMGGRIGYTMGADAAGKSTEKPIVEKDERGNVVRRTRVLGKSGLTTAAYLKAFGLSGIPHAFIVDKQGLLAWHGHPMDMEKPLKAILTGSYDLAAAKKADRTRQLAAKVQPIAQEYFVVVREGGDKKRAAEIGAKFVTEAREIPKVLESFAWAILTADGLKFRDVKLALQAAKAAHEATGGKDASILDTYARALFHSGNLTQAIQFQRQAVKTARDDATRALFAKALKLYEEQATKKP